MSSKTGDKISDRPITHADQELIKKSRGKEEAYLTRTQQFVPRS